MVIERIEDGMVFHYSDKGMKILQLETGVIYDDARDVYPCRFSYMETEEPIDEPNEEVAQ